MLLFHAPNASKLQNHLYSTHCTGLDLTALSSNESGSVSTSQWRENSLPSWARTNKGYSFFKLEVDFCAIISFASKLWSSRWRKCLSRQYSMHKQSSGFLPFFVASSCALLFAISRCKSYLPPHHASATAFPVHLMFGGWSPSTTPPSKSPESNPAL